MTHRDSTYGEFDAATLAEALARPGIDPRQWCSFATVDAQDPDSGDVPVQFPPEYGPLVNCTLHPSGLRVRCRVAMQCGGNGEGEWHPFIEGDEVLVLVPEGDEAAGCTIVGRLSNEIDQWPAVVAGQDATKNNFGFRRVRTPYIFETSDSWMVRSAATGANVVVQADGAVLLTNADKAFLSLNPDFLGLQNGDGNLLIQVDLHNQNIVLDAAGAKLTLDKNLTVLAGNGTIALSAMGVQPLENATSAQAVVNLTAQVLTLMWAGVVMGLQIVPDTSTGVALAGALTGLTNPAAIKGYLLAALGVAGTSGIEDYAMAIQGALAQKPGDPSGMHPSVGAPGILLG